MQILVFWFDILIYNDASIKHTIISVTIPKGSKSGSYTISNDKLIVSAIPNSSIYTGIMIIIVSIVDIITTSGEISITINTTFNASDVYMDCNIYYINKK